MTVPGGMVWRGGCEQVLHEKWPRIATRYTGSLGAGTPNVQRQWVARPAPATVVRTARIWCGWRSPSAAATRSADASSRALAARGIALLDACAVPASAQVNARAA